MKQIQYISRSALFLTLMILSAYLQISLPTPFWTMHITMQLFISILCGFCLPLSYTFLTMATYILLGLIGFPVFASGGGFYYLIKPTFGFVLGFLVCACVCSYQKKKNNPHKESDYFRIGLLGLFFFYFIGNLYYYFGFRIFLQTPIPLWLSLVNGFVVSILPDTLICWLACHVAKKLQIFFQ